ncbi:MAG: succinate dehydrogenase cytochrome b subunit [Acidobacteriota bacterium]
MGAVAIDTSLKKRFGLYEAYIGKKLVMAVTGVVLFGYVIGHLAGNLQIYIPPRVVDGQYVYPINNYARFLHSNPAALWAVRTLLLAAVFLHIWSALQLWLQKRRARPVGYYKKDDVPSAYASRTMMWSGPILAAFIVFHILHLTTGSVGLGFREAEAGEFYAFQNLVHGFRHPAVAIAYIVAIVLLSMHLYHGIWSMFQSVGISHPRWTPVIKRFAHWFAILIAAGYISIPLAVLARVVGSEVP